VAVLVEAIEESKSPVKKERGELLVSDVSAGKAEFGRKLKTARDMEVSLGAARAGRLSLGEQGVLQQRLAASEARTRAAEQRWQQAQEEVAAVKENVGKELNRLTEACQALQFEAAARAVDQQTIERLRAECERLQHQLTQVLGAAPTAQQQQQNGMRSLVEAQAAATVPPPSPGPATQLLQVANMPQPAEPTVRPVASPPPVVQACVSFAPGQPVSMRHLSPAVTHRMLSPRLGNAPAPLLTQSDGNLRASVSLGGSVSLPANAGVYRQVGSVGSVGSSPNANAPTVSFSPASPKTEAPPLRFRSPRLTAPAELTGLSAQVSAPAGLSQFFA
jgi:hypothetical protein